MAAKGFISCKLFINFLTKASTPSCRGFKRYVSASLMELKRRQKKYFKGITKEEYNELTRRSNFIEWNYSAEVFAFGKRLQEEFPPELLVQAFTHRSYVSKEEVKQKEAGIENPIIVLKDNSSLASKGEEIISFYAPRYVSQFFPRFPYEGIQSIHDYLTSDELLAHVSKNLGTTFLILSADYPILVPTYAQTLKAIVGALEECQGLKRSQLFVRDFIVTQMVGRDVNDFLKVNNRLETLKKILERDGKEAPEPRILSKSAVNTLLANYHVGLYCNKQLMGHCSGETIDTAIEMAAFDALKRLFHTTDSCSPITYDAEHVPETIANLKLSEWNSAAFEKKSIALRS